MRVFICNNIIGHYPVGASAVIVAPDKLVATKLLRKALKDDGLDPDQNSFLDELSLDAPIAILLTNGDY